MVVVALLDAVTSWTCRCSFTLATSAKTTKLLHSLSAPSSRDCTNNSDALTETSRCSYGYAAYSFSFSLPLPFLF